MAAVPVMDPVVEVAQQQILAVSTESEDLEWTTLQWLEFTWLCVLICWIGGQGLVDDCSDRRLVGAFTAFCRRRDATPYNRVGPPYWGSEVVDNSVVMAAVMSSAARLVFADDVYAQAEWFCDRLTPRLQPVQTFINVLAAHDSDVARAINERLWSKFRMRISSPYIDTWLLLAPFERRYPPLRPYVGNHR